MAKKSNTILFSKYLLDCVKNKNYHGYDNRYGFREVNIIHYIMGCINSSGSKNFAVLRIGEVKESTKEKCKGKLKKVNENQTLVEKFNCCEKTVSRALAKLKTLGSVSVSYWKSKGIVAFSFCRSLYQDMKDISEFMTEQFRVFRVKICEWNNHGYNDYDISDDGTYSWNLPIKELK